MKLYYTNSCRLVRGTVIKPLWWKLQVRLCIDIQTAVDCQQKWSREVRSLNEALSGAHNRYIRMVMIVYLASSEREVGMHIID